VWEHRAVPDRDERIAKNEVLFREVNERIEEAAQRASFEGPTVFVCECGSEECAEPLELTLAEYEAVRSQPTQFAVLPGHEMDRIERVVERSNHFVLVEKLNRPAEIASQNNPRTA
jgi:hypothetical protein